MSFSFSYLPCGIEGTSQIVVIEKDPLKKTYAEPVYNDLIEGKYSFPLLRDLPDEEKERIENFNNEAQGSSLRMSLEALSKLGFDVMRMAFDFEEYKRRETMFNTTEYEDSFKELTTGKPVNNNDPYPIDEKIEELQSHNPFLKIHKMEYCGADANLIKLTQEVMNLSDKTEKRLVKIENIMTTIVRNLFRVSSRMQINCVYYGGQDIYKKYNCIRCLHDDRISDGQSMSLDQCLSCTRYEPILGQVYEIMDETGANINVILDDNQMGYTTMQEYIQFTRNEKDYNPVERSLIDMSKLTSRGSDEYDFIDMWDEGFIMNWDLTPVEEQKPHVNYEDGSQTKSLPSDYNKAGFTYSSSDGKGFYSGLQSQQDIVRQINLNDLAFNINSNAKFKEYINDGLRYATAETDQTLINMKNLGYESILRKVCEEEGVDPLLILSIIVVESGGLVSHPNDLIPGDNYWGLMQTDKTRLSSGWRDKPTLEKAEESIRVGVKMYKEKLQACWQTSNILLGLVAYNSGEGMLLGVSSSGVLPVYNPGLNIIDKEDWSWIDIANNLERNVIQYYGQRSVYEKLTYYPRMHYVYKILLEKAYFSPFDSSLDGVEYKFPFSPEDTLGITFTSDYGLRVDPVTNEWTQHLGIDLAGDLGTHVLSAASGIVTNISFSEGGGQTITIQHDNDVYTSYLHLIKDSQRVKVGQQIQAGHHIADLGSTGKSTGPHLHFEVMRGPSRMNTIDPKIIFPFLKGQLRKLLK